MDSTVTLLLVHADNHGTRKVLMTFARETGARMSAVTVSNVQHALAMVEGKAVDAVVLDLSKAQPEVWKAYERICARLPDAAVVMVTSTYDDVTPHEAARRGIRGHVARLPLCGPELLVAVQHAVDARSGANCTAEMADLVPMPIIVLNSSAHVEIWNVAAESSFGWRKRETIGKLHPWAACNLSDVGLREQLNRGAHSARPMTVSGCLSRRSGSPVIATLAMTGSVLPRQRTLAVIVDVTAVGAPHIAPLRGRDS